MGRFLDKLAGHLIKALPPGAVLGIRIEWIGMRRQGMKRPGSEVPFTDTQGQWVLRQYLFCQRGAGSRHADDEHRLHAVQPEVASFIKPACIERCNQTVAVGPVAVPVIIPIALALIAPLKCVALLDVPGGLSPFALAIVQ